MFHESTLEALNAELVALKRQRDRARRDVDRCALQIGATTTFLRDQLGQSKAASAQILGMSPSHLTEFMAQADRAGVRLPDPQERVPRVTGTKQVSDFVQAHRGLRRIVASFAEGDTLYLSGVRPESLMVGDALTVPNLMLQAVDGSWAAVENVNVGYGGQGPRFVGEILEALALPNEVAEEVAYTRVSDVWLDAALAKDMNRSLSTVEWPRVALPVPERVGDAWVVRLRPDTLVPPPTPARASSSFFSDTRPDDLPAVDTGFDPALRDTPVVDRCLEFLDSAECPGWMKGDRRVRAYLTYEAAHSDGFIENPQWSYGWGNYTLIIEQGDLQLWIEPPLNVADDTWFTPDVYRVLERAGFYTLDLKNQDAARASRSAFMRWIRSFGVMRPPYVDLTGEPLRHLPVRP